MQYNPNDIVEAGKGMIEVFEGTKKIIAEMVGTKEINQEIETVRSNLAALKKYAFESAVDVVTQLAAASSDVEFAILKIVGCAQELKANSEVVITYSDMSEYKTANRLTGNQLELWKASIEILSESFTVADAKLGEAQATLKKIATELNQTTLRLETIADEIRANGKGETDKYKEYAESLRAKAYGGCAASVVFPPALPVCYGTALGIVESKLTAYRNECNGYNQKAQTVADQMGSLSTKSADTRDQSLKWFKLA